MSTPNNPPISYAPSSEPFYANIPAAPISAADYGQAPPVGSATYGSPEQANPYAGMGYDTLPPAEGARAHPTPLEQDDQPAPSPAASAQAYSPQTPTTSYLLDDPAHDFYESGPPSVADLYRAPGNPYADRSGRSLNAAAPEAEPHGLAPTPQEPTVGYSPHASSYTITTPPSPSRLPGAPGSKARWVGVAGFIAVIMIVGFVVQGISALLSNFTSDSEPTQAAGLTTVADTELQSGMCFEELSYVSGNQLQPVACAEPHRFEVAENIVGPWADYPGEEEVAEYAAEQCTAVAEETTAAFGTRPLNSHSLYPSAGTWANGDREVTCFIGIAGSARLHGSAHDGDLEVR